MRCDIDSSEFLNIKRSASNAGDNFLNCVNMNVVDPARNANNMFNWSS